MNAALPPALESVHAAAGWPLTAIEEFLWLNDAPEHPMVFRVILSFSGQCDRAAAEGAFHEAILRHPFLCSRLADEGGRLRLVPATELPQLRWRESGDDLSLTEDLPIVPIDPRSEPALRTEIWQLPAGVRVILDVHHLCADGQGIRQFATEWFALYWRNGGGSPRPLPEVQVERLAKRDFFPALGPQVGGLEGLRNLWHTLWGRTARLPFGKRALSGGEEPKSSHLVQRVCTAEETAAIRSRLRAEQFSINDAGLAASMGTFAELFPQQARGRVISVINPVDLRRASDLRLPVCNRLGFVFLRRRMSEDVTISQLMHSLRGEMKYIKAKRVGEEFAKGLQLARRVPRGIWRLIHGGWFTPSLLFTCLGETTSLFRHKKPAEGQVLSVPGMQLEQISGYAPLGWGVPISVTVCETNSVLSVTVRASTLALDETTTVRFAENFLRRVNAWGAGQL